ncbi:hypothetical protein DFQ27_006616 [Actinomortierella ambigua]|uniref:ABC transporter domain-containing protein n=1 Tax=Actinomortierella ambigua TaxID=1343610 RepID=A0A9P6U178_9FUNG|nr:hypothetical protein DFQ27_006616 [Actinomortierella ambigua]
MTYRVCFQIQVFDRERKDRWYGPFPYAVSSLLQNLPIAVIASVAYGSIFYYLAHLRTDSAVYFLYFLLVNIAQQAVLLELTGRVFSCPFIPNQINPDPCKIARGDYILSENGGLRPHFFPSYLCVFVIAFMTLAWLFLTLNVVDPSNQAQDSSLLEQVFSLFKMPSISSDRLANAKRKHEPTRGPNEKDDEEVAINPSTLRSESEGAASITIDIAQDVTVRPSSLSKGSNDASRLVSYRQMLQQRDPVRIRIENLTITARKTKWACDPQVAKFGGWRRHVVEKRILDDVSLNFPTGELTAIIGASGAGKTSLLNMILNRRPSNITVDGDIWFNGSKNPSYSMINTVCGYVRQDDSFLLSHLTVRETLQYAAELSMNKDLTKAEKFARIEAIMEFMGLLECAEVIIGSTQTKGCSGGQRRRVSIALQLIIEPACLVLDEPTTGLDAMAALGIVRILKAIARTGRTVICCIHQPGQAIWEELDNVVLLLHGGRLGYTGEREQVRDYFGQQGHIPLKYTNIPDFILDIASIDHRSSESAALSRQRVDGLANHFRQHQSKSCDEATMKSESTVNSITSRTQMEGLPKLGRRAQHHASFFQATGILSRRSFTNTFRQKALFFNRVFMPFGTAIAAEPFFSGLDYSQVSLMERLTFAMHLNFYAMTGFLICSSLFPRERNLALYEISNGAYGATSFIVSYLINEVPLNVIAAGIVTAFTYCIVPIQAGVERMALFYYVILTFLTMGESLAITICTWTSHDGIMVNIAGSMLGFLALMAGTTVRNIPKIYQWANHGSLMRYGSAAIAISELSDLEVGCTREQEIALKCMFKTGDSMLHYAQLHHLSITECIVMMTTLTIVYRVIAWLSLTVRVWILQR